MGVVRAEPARVTDWAAKSVGAAWRAFDLQLAVYATLLAATGLANNGYETLAPAAQDYIAAIQRAVRTPIATAL